MLVSDRNCAIWKFNSVTIQSSFNVHHSRPPTASKPVSKVNSLVKYLIYCSTSQPRVDLCTASGGKRPSLRAKDMLPGTSA